MGDGLSAGVIYQQICETLCACDLVFGGEYNTVNLCYLFDSLAHDGMSRYLVSISHAYKSSLLSKRDTDGIRDLPPRPATLDETIKTPARALIRAW